jgi:hypothetical protein
MSKGGTHDLIKGVFPNLSEKGDVFPNGGANPKVEIIKEWVIKWIKVRKG